MKRNTISKWSYIGLLSAVLLVLTVVLMLGSAYARYQQSVTKDIPLLVREPAKFKVTFGNGWTTQNERGSFAFSVDNQGHTEDAYFTLRLASTIGTQYDKADVYLVVKSENGVERAYKGVAMNRKDSPVDYEDMGEGNTYIFCNSEGEELSWKLEGSKKGDTSVQNFVLQLQGAKEPNLLELIVTETLRTE